MVDLRSSRTANATGYRPTLLGAQAVYTLVSPTLLLCTLSDIQSVRNSKPLFDQKHMYCILYIEFCCFSLYMADRRQKECIEGVSHVCREGNTCASCIAAGSVWHPIVALTMPQST